MPLARIPWSALALHDGDGDAPADVVPLLQEFRDTGSISGFVFEPLGLPHERENDASTWGPASPNDVDWTGFPEE